MHTFAAINDMGKQNHITSNILLRIPIGDSHYSEFF